MIRKILVYLEAKKHKVYNNSLITLYHGSDMRFGGLKATGPDFGNALEKPNFSLFGFMDKSEAYQWAAFKAIKNEKLRYQSESGDHVSSCYDCHIKKTIMTEKAYKWLLDTLKSKPLKFYVYTAESCIDNVGIGNDSTHEEFTFHNDGVIWTRKINTCELNISNVLRYVHIVTENEYRKIIANSNCLNSRGWMSILMIKEYGYQRKRNRELIDILFNYKWKEYNGKEILRVMKENNLHFFILTPLKRLILKGKRK